jgi:hypothetical protein
MKKVNDSIVEAYKEAEKRVTHVEFKKETNLLWKNFEKY